MWLHAHTLTPLFTLTNLDAWLTRRSTYPHLIHTRYAFIHLSLLPTSMAKAWLDTTRMGTPTPLVPGSDLPYATYRRERRGKGGCVYLCVHACACGGVSLPLPLSPAFLPWFFILSVCALSVCVLTLR